MKATGIVRRVDELGRVVLPVELRTMLNINVRDSMEIFTNENMIVLKKYEPACIFTQSMDDLVNYKGRNISKEAIKEMAVMAGLIPNEEDSIASDAGDTGETDNAGDTDNTGEIVVAAGDAVATEAVEESEESID